MTTDGGLRRLFQRHLPDADWQSIETPVSRGVPDINGCLYGQEFWIEFKLTSGWAVGLRPEQVAWLVRRARAGGRVFVAVRRRCLTGARRKAADELWLLPGAAAREILDRGLRETNLVLGTWAGGPVRWDWDGVRAVLMRKQRMII